MHLFTSLFFSLKDHRWETDDDEGGTEGNCLADRQAGMAGERQRDKATDKQTMTGRETYLWR